MLPTGFICVFYYFEVVSFCSYLVVFVMNRCAFCQMLISHHWCEHVILFLYYISVVCCIDYFCILNKIHKIFILVNFITAYATNCIGNKPMKCFQYSSLSYRLRIKMCNLPSTFLISCNGFTMYNYSEPKSVSTT